MLSKETPGMKEVAKLSGVSVATVSYVLNGTQPVAQATRERVLQAVKELHYRPNLMARGLKTNKTGMVGVLIPDLYSSYFSHLLLNVEDALYQAGYQMLVCSSQGILEREERFLASLTHQMEGLIVAPAEPATSRLLADWERTSRPLVFVDRKPSPVDLAPYVTSDNESAGAAVFQHLQRRYEQLAAISPYPAQGVVQERLAGFMSAAIRGGVTPLTCFSAQETRRNAGRTQMECLLRKRSGTLGVFCTTNAAAIGCVSLLKAEGVEIGSDVGVIGYDDSDWMLLSQPTISAVRTDPELIGRRAARILLDLLAGRAPAASSQTAAQLIVRESSLLPNDPSRGDDW